MRRLTRDEMKQRGCLYCLDYKMLKHDEKKRKMCMHDKCPYRELDGYKTYNQFLKDTGFDISMLIRPRERKKG